MTFLDAVRFAMRSIVRRKSRAVLTVVSVTIGAALLVALLVISQTVETRVIQTIVGGGALASIEVTPQSPLDQPVDDAAVAELEALPLVESATPVIGVPILAIVGDASTDDRTRVLDDGAELIMGVDMGIAIDLPITVTSGRLPDVGSTTEIVITARYLREMGLSADDATDVLGSRLSVDVGRSAEFERIEHMWASYEIVGVVSHDIGLGLGIVDNAAIEPLHAWLSSGIADVPLPRPPGPYGGVVAEATSIDEVSAAKQQIEALGYETESPENLIENVQQYLTIVGIMLGGVGGIAVLIAAIGISNALLASVRERRREIGVIKAIGARDRDILNIFLTEAGLLGLMGGVIGTAIGIGLAVAVGDAVNDFLVSRGRIGIRVDVQPLVVFAGIAGSTLLALVAGWPPARRASRLPAKEAIDE